MGCTLCLNKSEMASFFNSFEENKSDFKYINECKFYGKKIHNFIWEVIQNTEILRFGLPKF